MQINIELSPLPVYDARCIKTKVRTFDDNVCINFCGLNEQEDDGECEFLQPFLLIHYLFLKADITWKDI